MNETERAQFAELLRGVRTSRYKGNKKAAYTAAGVNSATWDRAERGEPLREHTRISLVSALWPETGGDWTKIGDADEPEDEIGFTTYADLRNRRYDARHMAARLDELAAENAELQRRLAAAEERIEELYPSDPRTAEETAADSRRFHEMGEAFDREARALGLTRGEYLTHLRAEWGEPNVVSPLAARRGVSQGQQLRRVQDEAGEESQDGGGSDGAESSP